MNKQEIVKELRLLSHDLRQDLPPLSDEQLAKKLEYLATQIENLRSD